MILSPILAIGGAVVKKIQLASTTDQNEKEQAADLMCGDCLVNFKTVQSFGNEEMIFKLYEDSLTPSHKVSNAANMKVGIVIGINQFALYSVMAAMFYVGGYLIKESIDPVTKQPTLNPKDVFTAIFGIMFGAFNAGNAAAFAPDMGKAKAAATRVFKIMDYPSKINAMD